MGSDPIKTLTRAVAAPLTGAASLLPGVQKAEDTAVSTTKMLATGGTDAATPLAPALPGDVTTPTNSQSAEDEASKRQRQAQGASSTILNRGGGGLLSSGYSQRMLLGS